MRSPAVAASATADRVIASLLVAGTIVVPLVFSLDHDDVFGLPKTIVVRGLAVLLVGLLAVRLAGTGGLLNALTRRGLWVVAAFVALNGLAFVLAVDPQHALGGERYQHLGLLTVLALVVLLLAAAVALDSVTRIRLLLAGIVASAVLVSNFAIAQRVGIDPIWTDIPFSRAFSTLGQANSLAAYLVMAAAAAVGLARATRGFWRSAAAIALILIVVGLALTFSRGGYLGLTAAGAVIGVAWLATPHRRVRAAAAQAVVALTAFILVAAIVPGVRATVDSVVGRAAQTTDLDEGSIRGHFDLWAVGFAIARDHALVGAGQDSYVLMFGDYRDSVLSADRAAILSHFRPESPHNHYLAIAGGAGLPALVAYAALVALASVRFARLIRGSPSAEVRAMASALLAMLVGHLVTDSFMTAEVTGSMLFWIAIGIGLAWPGVPSPSGTPTSRDRQRPPSVRV